MAGNVEMNPKTSNGKTDGNFVHIPQETHTIGTDNANNTTSDANATGTILSEDTKQKTEDDTFDDVCFSLVHTFRVQSEDRDPWVRHLEVLADGNILLADRYNRRLLLYDNNGILLKQVKLPSGPWSMTLTNNNLVAVTLPDNKAVVLVFTDTLKISNKFQVHDDCRGIACIGSKLFVNCVTNGLKLLTMTGRTIKVFPQYVGYMGLARGPKDRLLATLFAEDRVICLNLKGKLRYDFTLKSLCGPTSFAVDATNGLLYIVGHNGNTINLVGNKGKQSRVLLTKKDGIDRPWAIGYDCCVKRLFISNFGGKNISVHHRSEEKRSLAQVEEEMEN